MREIKFRGKRIDNDEWVYGCLTRYSEEMSYITVDLIEGEVYQVKTETVGQYTGLKDKNGKEIYEGDIVKQIFYYCEGFNIGEVVYLNSRFCTYGEDFGYFMLAEFCHKNEVIGNIYENRDLLQDINCIFCNNYSSTDENDYCDTCNDFDKFVRVND